MSLVLEQLKNVFKVFCFEGKINQIDEDTFKLTLECYDEDMSGLDADYVFQDVMKAFERVHKADTLRRINRIELEYDNFCRDGYVIVEKHLEGYSETN